MYFDRFETSKQFKFLTQNSTTTTTSNMLILIFKCQNYVNNHFSKLIPHEIALWCYKIGILEICLETSVSLYVPRRGYGLVVTALKFSI